MTRWSPQATNACKKTARPCAWWTCHSPVADDLRERVDLVVKADLAVNKVQVKLALVRLVVQVRVQVLPLHPPPKPVAPVQASQLWPSQAPTLA